MPVGRPADRRLSQTTKTSAAFISARGTHRFRHLMRLFSPHREKVSGWPTGQFPARFTHGAPLRRFSRSPIFLAEYVAAATVFGRVLEALHHSPRPTLRRVHCTRTERTRAADGTGTRFARFRRALINSGLLTVAQLAIEWPMALRRPMSTGSVVLLHCTSSECHGRASRSSLAVGA